MTENPETQDAAKGSRVKPPTPPSPPAPERKSEEPPQKRFLDAYQDLQEGLQKAWDDAQQTSHEAQRTLQLELHRVQLEAQKSWEEACRKGLQSARETAGPDSGREYQKSLRTLQEKGRQGWEDAQREWQETLQNAQETFRNGCDSAWLDYLKAVQAAWAKADLEHLDPRSVAHVGSTLVAAGNTGARAPRS
jgi:hypothetical protein